MKTKNRFAVEQVILLRFLNTSKVNFPLLYQICSRRDHSCLTFDNGRMDNKQREKKRKRVIFGLWPVLFFSKKTDGTWEISSEWLAALCELAPGGSFFIKDSRSHMLCFLQTSLLTRPCSTLAKSMGRQSSPTTSSDVSQFSWWEYQGRADLVPFLLDWYWVGWKLVPMFSRLTPRIISHLSSGPEPTLE